MNPIADDGPAVDDAYPRDARGRPDDPRLVPASLLALAGDAERPRSEHELHRPLRVYHRETSARHEFYPAGDTGSEVIVTELGRSASDTSSRKTYGCRGRRSVRRRSNQ